MSNVIPDPKAPKESTDYIYGDRMEPFEDRMNFFLNKKVELNKDNVKEEDKAEVAGLESLIARFSTFNTLTLVSGVEDVSGCDTVSGMEAMAGKAKSLIDTLVQMAKDIVDWLVQLATNRIRRIDNRLYRVKLERKRAGLTSLYVRYPAGIRRLVSPTKVSVDGNWVAASLSEVNGFYKNSAKAYRHLTGLISKSGPDINLKDEMNDTIKAVAGIMGMSLEGNTYVSAVLPGNRVFCLDLANDPNSDQLGIYFTDSTIDARLKSPTFAPTSFMIDNTFRTMNEMIKEITSNQSTMTQLSRQFEKKAKSHSNEGGNPISPDQRKYLNWIIRFNKRLMNLSIQYTINSMDSGLDFCQAGINK